MRYHRNRFRWKIRNNYVFFIIIVIICAIVALLVGTETYNYERTKSIEAILDKTTKTIHRRTGITDQDVQKLNKQYPNFNWENTWDRRRWLDGNEQERVRLQREKARQSYKLQKEERLRQLGEKGYKARGIR